MRSGKSVLSGVKEASVDTLAKQLIKRKTSKLNLSAYKDDYEAAVKKLVEAKRKGKPLTAPEPEVKKPKLVNIIDALRSSLSQEKKPKTPTWRTKAA